MVGLIMVYFDSPTMIKRRYFVAGTKLLGVVKLYAHLGRFLNDIRTSIFAAHIHSHTLSHFDETL